jgi:hypothetical protein
MVMAEYPLLVFPEPSRAERAKRGGGGGKFSLPNAQQQAQRLDPLFVRLQEAMNRKGLSLQNNAFGIQPEQVLVLETIGPIQNFLNAVKNVQGLEWMCDFDGDDIAPGDGFADEEDPEKQMKGHLYLVMTDQSALRELQSLFNKWKQNPDVPFPRGLAPLRHAFTHLYTIRPWDAHDRVRDTGVLEDWGLRLAEGQSVVPFAAELWFRGDANRRQQAEAFLRNVIESLGGEVVQQCVISDIAYHGILGRLPVAQVGEIVAQREVRLLQCEDIMHLRPVGQCALRVPDATVESVPSLGNIDQSAPRGMEPLVALFDGMPLTGHRLLDGRLIVDDPDGFESAYQARDRVHGTAMASLICHGDLNAGFGAVERPVYVRPIMQPRRGFSGQTFEAIPDNILPLDLIYRAVRRLYDTEGGEPPAAPTVRVINLSVCDRSRPLDRGISSWARLLDWLAWKYNVLFVVSAGNHSQDVELGIPRTDLTKLTPVDREKVVIEAIVRDTRHRRLLSPAETFNGITVGALHQDASTPLVNANLIDPFSRTGLPSTISAHGPGFHRSIKPDIMLPGGRQFLSEKLGTVHANSVLQTAYYSRPPGQCVATPGPSGEIDRTSHTRGTSNAAALASRLTMRLYDVIGHLRTESGTVLTSEYDIVLLKALLVHGSDWGDAGLLYEGILRTPQNARTLDETVGRFLGYGSVHEARAVVCTDQRVTVIGVGKLADGEGDEFILPLPPSLSAVTEKRRLTVTLAWMTPVSSTRQEYRIAQLWFSPKHPIVNKRIGVDWRAAQRGTVQHEVLESSDAIDFQDGDMIAIKVNCRADAGAIITPIRFALVVTLEVAEGVTLPIYQEVRDRLGIRVRVPGGGVR